MAYPNPFFSASALLGFLLCVISCPWHLTSWNTGACLYAFWTGLGCLNAFINSVVWDHNAINRAPVFCDISTKLTIGISIGIPTASFCICRRLYIISSLKSLSISTAVARRSIIIDSLVGLGFPLLIMSLHYIVQGHRFDVFEDIGCSSSVYFTWQAYLMISTPPIVIGLVSAVYAVLNIKQFYKMRNHLQTERPENGIPVSMYVRFVCLSSIEVVCTTPLALFFLVYGATVLKFRHPWISWTDTHYNFSRVIIVPAAKWRMSPVAHTMELNRWLNVICAIVFFAFFGYTDETKTRYKHALEVISRRVGFRWNLKTKQLAPIHFKSLRFTSHGSLESFTDGNYSSVAEVDKKQDLDRNPDTIILDLSTSDSSNEPRPVMKSTQMPGDTETCFKEARPPLDFIPPPPSAYIRPRSIVEAINPRCLSTSERLSASTRDDIV